jgi:hypothetical protein
MPPGGPPADRLVGGQGFLGVLAMGGGPGQFPAAVAGA